MLYIGWSAECKPLLGHEFDSTRSCCDVAFTGARALRLAAERGSRSRVERNGLLTEAAVAAGAVPLLHDLVQLTGGIGFTWKYGLHHYERRAHLHARLVGNPRRARRPWRSSRGGCRPHSG